MKLHFAVAVLLSSAFLSWTCSAQSYRPPRLEDGRVDLQGVWNFSNLTPLERLPGFDSLVISAEKAREIEERISGMRRTSRPEPRRNNSTRSEASSRSPANGAASEGRQVSEGMKLPYEVVADAVSASNAGSAASK